MDSKSLNYSNKLMKTVSSPSAFSFKSKNPSPWKKLMNPENRNNIVFCMG